MNPRLKNLIGVLAVLALLPLAFGTVSGGVSWLTNRIEQLQEKQERENHKRLVLKTKCTYADRRKRLEEELGPPPEQVPCPDGWVSGFHPCKVDVAAARQLNIQTELSYLDHTEEACLKRAQESSSSD